MEKLTIVVKSHFDAAHHLTKETEYNEKCLQNHGHRFYYKIYLKGDVSSNTDMVVDFGEIKDKIISRIDSYYDHKDLNLLIPNPTAERLAIDMADYIRGIILLKGFPIELVKLSLSETPSSSVIWQAKDYPLEVEE